MEMRNIKQTCDSLDIYSLESIRRLFSI